MTASAAGASDEATAADTSGTTGVPKGVMLSHRNLVTNVLNAVKTFPFPVMPEAKALSFLPLNHIFERVASYIYMSRGISVYYAENLDTIGDNLKEVKPVLFTTVPRLLEKVFDKIMTNGAKLKGIKKKLFYWAVDLAMRYDNLKSGGLFYNLQLSIANKLIFSKWREALGNNIQYIITGGAACGFVVTIPNHNLRIYHAGDTNIFSDMKLIDELYQPDIALLPIGDCLGMGPREAAYCVKNFLPTPHTIIPMHFNSFPVLTGTPDDFEKECEKIGVTNKKIIHPNKFVGG